MIPLVGFLPPEDPRVAGTTAAIERELMEDGFVHALPQRRALPRSTAFRREKAPSCHAPTGSATTTRCRTASTRRGAVRPGCCHSATMSASCRKQYDPREPAPGRQFPAGVLARVPDQHRAEPHPTSGAGARSGNVGRGARGSGLGLPRRSSQVQCASEGGDWGFGARDSGLGFRGLT